MRYLIFLFASLLSVTGNTNDVSFDHTDAAQLMEQTKYAETIIAAEKALADNPNKIGLFEPLTKSYSYLSLFDEAEQKTQELYFESGSEHPLLPVNGYCRYALFYTMQEQREPALKAVEQMLKHETPGNIYPGAPTCSVFFDTRWGNYERAEHNLQRVIQAAPELDGLIFLPWLVQVKKQLGKAAEAQQIMAQLVQTRMAMDSGAMDEKIAAAANGASTKGTQQIIQNWRAQVLLLEGKTDQALAAMQKAYEAGALFRYHWWKTINPIFAEVRSKEVFQRLMEQMEEDIELQRQKIVSG